MIVKDREEYLCPKRSPTPSPPFLQKGRRPRPGVHLHRRSEANFKDSHIDWLFLSFQILDTIFPFSASLLKTLGLTFFLIRSQNARNRSGHCHQDKPTKRIVPLTQHCYQFLKYYIKNFLKPVVNILANLLYLPPTIKRLGQSSVKT